MTQPPPIGALPRDQLVPEIRAPESQHMKLMRQPCTSDCPPHAGAWERVAQPPVTKLLQQGRRPPTSIPSHLPSLSGYWNNVFQSFLGPTATLPRVSTSVSSFLRLLLTSKGVLWLLGPKSFQGWCFFMDLCCRPRVFQEVSKLLIPRGIFYTLILSLASE